MADASYTSAPMGGRTPPKPVLALIEHYVRRDGEEGAMAALNSGGLDADQLALDGVDAEIISGLMECGTLVVELADDWTPTGFVLCCGPADCPRCSVKCRREGEACLKIQQDLTGEICYCEGYLYPLLPITWETEGEASSSAVTVVTEGAPEKEEPRRRLSAERRRLFEAFDQIAEKQGGRFIINGHLETLRQKIRTIPGWPQPHIPDTTLSEARAAWLEWGCYRRKGR